MNSFTNHFYTDWAAMTLNDWIGTSVTVVIFLLMAVAFFYVFRGGNRESLEAHRFIVFNEDSSKREDIKNG